MLLDALEELQRIAETAENGAHAPAAEISVQVGAFRHRNCRFGIFRGGVALGLEEKASEAVHVGQHEGAVVMRVVALPPVGYGGLRTHQPEGRMAAKRSHSGVESGVGHPVDAHAPVAAGVREQPFYGVVSVCGFVGQLLPGTERTQVLILPFRHVSAAHVLLHYYVAAVGEAAQLFAQIAGPAAAVRAERVAVADHQDGLFARPDRLVNGGVQPAAVAHRNHAFAPGIVVGPCIPDYAEDFDSRHRPPAGAVGGEAALGEPAPGAHDPEGIPLLNRHARVHQAAVSLVKQDDVAPENAPVRLNRVGAVDEFGCRQKPHKALAVRAAGVVDLDCPAVQAAGDICQKTAALRLPEPLHGVGSGHTGKLRHGGTQRGIHELQRPGHICTESGILHGPAGHGREIHEQQQRHRHHLLFRLLSVNTP